MRLSFVFMTASFILTTYLLIMLTIITRTLVFLAFASVTLMSCKKDNTDPHHHEENSNGIILRSQTINWHIGGDHTGSDHDSEAFLDTDQRQFEYDESGRLIAENSMEFVYNTDGFLAKTIKATDTIYYNYNNGKLSSVHTSCGYYDGGSFSDTTLFFYSDQLLKRSTSTHEKTTSEFVFENNRMVSKYISRSEADDVRNDTLVYTWENDNVTSICTKSASPYNAYYYQREFRYDDHPGYTRAILYPAEYLLVREITQFYGKYPFIYYESLPWRYNNANNPVEFKELNNDKTRLTTYEIHYNSNGFPSMIHTKDFEMILAYY